jgi:hypothetical protein
MAAHDLLKPNSGSIINRTISILRRGVGTCIRVLIVDYDAARRQHLAELLRARFGNYDVEQLAMELFLLRVTQ